jgi:hypothetical protein
MRCKAVHRFDSGRRLCCACKSWVVVQATAVHRQGSPKPPQTAQKAVYTMALAIGAADLREAHEAWRGESCGCCQPARRSDVSARRAFMTPVAPLLGADGQAPDASRGFRAILL